MVTDSHSVRNGDRVLAGAGLTIAATWAGLEVGDLPAYLFGSGWTSRSPGPGAAAARSPRFADRIVASLARPITVGRGPLRVRAGIGIAISRAGADEPDDLLKLAGMAMHTAKRHGDGYHLEGAVRVGS